MIANQLFIIPHCHILSSSFTLHRVVLEVSDLCLSYRLWFFGIVKGQTCDNDYLEKIPKIKE